MGAESLDTKPINSSTWGRKENIMTTLQTTVLTLAVVATLNADGTVNWDQSFPGIQEAVDLQVQDTKLIREDIVDILDAQNETYVDEGTLVSKVLSRQEKRQRTALLAMNPDFDDEDVFDMAETTARRAKIQSFIDKNRTTVKGEGDAKVVTVGLFQSRRGRSGGIQTSDNAEHIEHLADAKRKKLDK